MSGDESATEVKEEPGDCSSTDDDDDEEEQGEQFISIPKFSRPTRTRSIRVKVEVDESEDEELDKDREFVLSNNENLKRRGRKPNPKAKDKTKRNTEYKREYRRRKRLEDQKIKAERGDEPDDEETRKKKEKKKAFMREYMQKYRERNRPNNSASENFTAPSSSTRRIRGKQRGEKLSEEEKKMRVRQQRREAYQQKVIQELQEKAQMTEDELNAKKMDRYMQYQAKISSMSKEELEQLKETKNKYYRNLPEEKKREKIQRTKEWRRSLTGEKRKRNLESIRKSYQRRLEEMKKDPEKYAEFMRKKTDRERDRLKRVKMGEAPKRTYRWNTGETEEERNTRIKSRKRMEVERVKLKKKLKVQRLLAQGMSMEEIQYNLETIEKREQRLIRLRKGQAKRDLRKKLINSGASPEEIEAQLEHFEATYQSSRPFSVYKPRPQTLAPLVPSDLEVLRKGKVPLESVLEGVVGTLSNKEVSFSPNNAATLEPVTEVIPPSNPFSNSPSNPTAPHSHPSTTTTTTTFQQELDMEMGCTNHHQNNYGATTSSSQSGAADEDFQGDYDYSAPSTPNVVREEEVPYFRAEDDIPSSHNEITSSNSTCTLFELPEPIPAYNSIPNAGPSSTSSSSFSPFLPLSNSTESTPAPVVPGNSAKAKNKKPRVLKSTTGRKERKVGTILKSGLKRDRVCETCGVAFTARYITDHRLLYHHPNYDPIKKSCTLCNMTFSGSRAFYYKHWIKVHKYDDKNKDELNYVCELCGARFKSKTGHLFHMQYKHSTFSKVVCPHPGCGKEYMRQITLNSHLRKVHNGEGVSSHSRLQCVRCPSRFGDVNMLKEHVQSEHPDSYFACPNCDKMKFTLTALKFHSRDCKGRITKGVKVEKEILDRMAVTCEVCPIKVKLFSLKRHYKDVHGIFEEDFECRECQKMFKTREYLLAHSEMVHGVNVEDVLEELRKYNVKDRSSVTVKQGVKFLMMMERKKAREERKKSEPKAKRSRKKPVRNEDEDQQSSDGDWLPSPLGGEKNARKSGVRKGKTRTLRVKADKQKNLKERKCDANSVEKEKRLVITLIRLTSRDIAKATKKTDATGADYNNEEVKVEPFFHQDVEQVIKRENEEDEWSEY